MWTLHLLQECLHWRFYLWSGFILFFHLATSFPGLDIVLQQARSPAARRLTPHQLVLCEAPQPSTKAPPTLSWHHWLQTMAHRCKRGDNGDVCALFTNSISESNGVIILLICPYAQLCPTLVPRWEDLTCAPNAGWLKQSHDVRPSQNISDGDDRGCLQGICQIRLVTWKCLLINKNLVLNHYFTMDLVDNY